MARRTAKQRAATKRLVALNKKRKSKRVKRTTTRRKPMARRRRARTRTRTRTVTRYARRGGKGIKGIFKSGMLQKASAGIGAGVIAGLVLDRFAPQFSEIGKPIAGFMAGGPIGAIAPLVLSGGLSGITGMFGGAKAEAGGL
jgi:hypothetical protein